ncbi:pyridoxine/pyridoxal/pyridoxamine kinase [Sporolactobacillus inulinus]|uniref:pyridoxal kinase n=1 Tax=Sporolactobacillus inulinus CASD TaxID=1069536 RepID=A0A0U1QS21_9BACL|nr:pyridoxine/pyridoxal/pyridoxamine kinase [Sporolactobacillus inulinus]KLI03595.1 pyridoxal kinase [Sporolactobacillus inulinus CASD]GEB78217.1 hydroxymethylpyrimidine/phosphomethylpyrimidine kinase [Sporolactobacillus inulinus]
MTTLNKALTIAGSDSSGGAGMQADLKTFQELGIYGMTALTCIVTMDPHKSWAHSVTALDTELLKKQLDTIIVGIGVDAMKTGMLASPEIIKIAADAIEKNHLARVVIDPVMVCKGAEEEIQPELQPENTAAMLDYLIPKALVTTPNLYEAARLTGMPRITSVDQMKEAAKKIVALGAKNALVKGGSRLPNTDQAIDVLYDGKDFHIIADDYIDTPNIHGAGCTYAAAVTAGLAKGQPVLEAVQVAKKFVTAAIRGSFRLNDYTGPTDHSAYKKELAAHR